MRPPANNSQVTLKLPAMAEVEQSTPVAASPVAAAPAAAAAAASPKPKKAPAKKAASGAPKAKPTHPKTSEMVNGALAGLKERSGSSLQAIKKYIGAHYSVDAEKLAPFIRDNQVCSIHDSCVGIQENTAFIT